MEMHFNSMVVELIRQSQSVQELEAGLRREGFGKTSSRKMRRFLLDHWKAANARAIEQTMSEELAAQDHLPGTEVSREGVNFMVHGVVHGQRSSVSEEVRETVGGLASPLMNTPGHRLLLEYGMDRMFRLPRSQRMETGQQLHQGYGLGAALLLTTLAAFLPLFALAARL